MQARVDWVLIIFGTQVINKKWPVRPVFPDYLSVSYNYDFTDAKVCNFIKKRLQHKCFSVNIANFLRTPILKNICGRLNRFWNWSYGQLPPRKIAARIIPPWMIAPGQLPQRYFPPWQYSPGNCSRGKLPFGWFVAYIMPLVQMVPRKTSPQENSPKDELHPRYFFPKNQKS